MDFEYSGSVQTLSPTHPHASIVLPSINQIRRSLSQSPCKRARLDFKIMTDLGDSPLGIKKNRHVKRVLSDTSANVARIPSLEPIKFVLPRSPAVMNLSSMEDKALSPDSTPFRVNRAGLHARKTQRSAKDPIELPVRSLPVTRVFGQTLATSTPTNTTEKPRIEPTASLPSSRGLVSKRRASHIESSPPAARPDTPERNLVRRASRLSMSDLSPTSSHHAPVAPKSNSLRSELFRRSRQPVGPATFVPPHTPTANSKHPSPSPQTPHTHQWSNEPTTPPSFNPRRPQLAGINVGIVNNEVDTCLNARFGEVRFLANGVFSKVYQVSKPKSGSLACEGTAWAVKKTKAPIKGPLHRKKLMKEVEILQGLRHKEHVIHMVDYWEENGEHLYIQTEFCENGTLASFLEDAGTRGRIDVFRIWKSLLEIADGLDDVHSAGIMHLDLKPANIFVTFGGYLKIGDFGISSKVPPTPSHNGEGDKFYIAQEVVRGTLTPAADIFALGVIMLEIASNQYPPSGGDTWLSLREGNISVMLNCTDTSIPYLPSLTSSSDNSLERDASGLPVTPSKDQDIGFLLGHPRSVEPYTAGTAKPPPFMTSAEDKDALDALVSAMVQSDHLTRPSARDLLNHHGVSWVRQRRRAGATVYEGPYGPPDDVEMGDA
ncbi:hypothetical protein LTR50_000801 [Elasticomyces elasticus]|nr:hypothetical protein LTR50_000801 [Elasticomyces elasticus]